MAGKAKKDIEKKTAEQLSEAGANAPEVGKGEPRTVFSDPDGGKEEFTFSNAPEPKDDKKD
jgi:hypothetical protein